MSAERTDFAAQRTLVGRLAAALGAAVIETHISWVLVAGGFAYKVKKALDLGFLDFTTLAARCRFCELEVELNRRLAPAIYLDVVAIGGSLERPALGVPGNALDYAVRMREFPQDALASRVLARGELTSAHIDALAADVAAFHGTVAVAGPDGPFGRPVDILHYALENFARTRELAIDDERAALAALEAWTRDEYAHHAQRFDERRAHGFIRECHGDLHLGNMVLIGDRVTVFDCIEFDERLRWIDVASEIAFVVMDLDDRGSARFAHRFLNAWLEHTGDYDAVALLPFYLVYRAMVRAKVTRLRVAQVEAGAARAAFVDEYRSYLALAQRFARAPRPALVVTHGFSGSGKTAATQALLEAAGGVRVRTDVERKRLAGLPRGARSESGVGERLYADGANRRTYERVAAIAESLLRTGELAIVDAACLRRWQRDLFRAVAAKLAVPFVIVSFDASEATLRRRIGARLAARVDASEADLAVLDHQLVSAEPLAGDEAAFVVSRDTDVVASDDAVSWRDVLQRVGRAPLEIPPEQARKPFQSALPL